MALDWDNFVKQVMERVDLSEFLGQYTTLKRTGSRYMGCCPLHAEKKPSFSVSPDLGLWHCFGCGKGGNIFTFLTEKEGLTFIDAAELLSTRYNIPLPSREKRQDVSPTKALYELHELASEYYGRFIRSSAGQPFKDYLRKRRITKDIVERFNIGAAPNEWDSLLYYLRKKGFNDQIILSSGLALKGEKGNIYDRFRNRLIIPINDHLNRTVGFGGRVIDDGEPKYLNSSESPIFKKSEILFGFALAKDSIRKENAVIIMEGYTDVMRAHQLGFTNAVASMGTALTLKHIEGISKHTGNVFLAFDGDDAGITAAIRSTEVLIKTDLVTKVVIFDEGLDPEEFLKTRGKEEFSKRLHKSMDGVRFLVECLIPDEIPIDYKSREVIFKNTLKYVTAIPDASERNKVLTEIASRLELSVDVVRDFYNKFKAGYRRDDSLIVKPIVSAEKPSEIETHILRYIINFPQLRKNIRKHLEPSEFQHEAYKRFLTVLFDPGFPIEHDNLQELPQIYNNNEFLGLVSGFMASLDDSFKYTCGTFCFWIAKLKERSIEALRKHNKRLILEANKADDIETFEKLQRENARLACEKEWYRKEFNLDMES